MGKAAMMNNDTTGNGRASLEHYGQICYDQQNVKNRNSSGSQNFASSGTDESRVNDVGGNIRHGPGMEVCTRDLKIQPQQTPGPIVNWERFLPVKSVKVLLVESDDSTRHVVSALLRNCSYEVTAVAHGLQAWRTLQDASSRIDLVLTEVVMPFLSGMDLLCKIMGHKTLKNIPVIMMSSHDSMGIVFKCLSKGAVDFLAKPIRKNELKNLWQHVWRRTYSLSGSGSGSGSESGTQAEQPANLRIANDSESNTSNNSDGNGNGSNGLSIQNCSGDGSGTETSWIKKAAESKHASPWDQRPESDAPDSICAEVMIYVGPEKHHNMDDQQLDIATGKDIRSENPSACKGMKIEDALSEVQCKPEEKGQQDQERDTCGKLRSEGFKVGGGGGVANCSIPQPQNRDCNGAGTKRKIDQGGVHNLEQTLKRLHAMADDGNTAKNDHNILRHSDLSAFSKYNTMSSINRGPLGNKGSSPLENGSDAMRPGVALSTQESNGSTKNNQLVFKSSESSAFQPVQNGNQKASSKETEPPSKASHQKVQVQHHHHHHHHHHYHHHHQTPDLNENISDPAVVAPPCRSSNLANSIEENGGNVSGGGSNQGSDGNNNGSNNTPSGGDDTENGTTKNSGSGGFSGNTNSSAMIDVRVALREAALTKFRLKRKERCFDKKVRYQSRKKLAEQRPRMKGQFVKQIKSEGKSGEERQQNRVVKDICDTDR